MTNLEDIQGPCLPWCFSYYQITFIFIGLIIGIILYHLYLKFYNKTNNKSNNIKVI